MGAVVEVAAEVVVVAAAGDVGEEQRQKFLELKG